VQALCGLKPALYPLGYGVAPLWQTYQLWGFEGMMEMIATHPFLVQRACERYMAHCVRAIHEAAFQGAAGIWIEDCLTDMISERDLTALNVPYLCRLTDEIRSAGMQSIHYFCGNPKGKWEALLAVDADALALEESKKGFTIDIAEVAKRVHGRRALLGNLDAIGILQDANDDALKAEIMRQMEAGRRNGSRFIMSIGSPVTPGTPVSRVRHFCDLVHELG
jgi:uroporphyrinogen-III decarboxylase